MSGSTPIYGLRYFTILDQPDLPKLGKDLAEDVEAELARIDGTLVDLDALRHDNSAGFGAFAGSTHSTNVGTYADLAAPSSTTISKEKSATTLKVSLQVQFASSATDTGVEFAVNVNGVDWLVAPYHQALPAANARLTAAGTTFITGLAAGVYTAQVRWRRSSGSGTISRIINDDWVALVVEEVR